MIKKEALTVMENFISLLNVVISFYLSIYFLDLLIILVSAFFCLGDGDQSTTTIWNSTNQMGSWMPTISSVSPVKLSTNCKYH